MGTKFPSPIMNCPLFRSEEENIIISDLVPATWYNVQLTAHNGAGSRVVTSQVATLDSRGRTLPPPTLPPPPVHSLQPGEVDGSVAIPVISAILITTTLMLVAVYIYRKRR